MFGQHLHFTKYADTRVPYAVERYGTEVHRLLKVLNTRLSEVSYLAEEYSIADIACFPWVVRTEWMDIDLGEYAHVRRWFETIQQRPAVEKGMVALAIEPAVAKYVSRDEDGSRDEKPEVRL